MKKKVLIVAMLLIGINSISQTETESLTFKNSIELGVANVGKLTSAYLDYRKHLSKWNLKVRYQHEFQSYSYHGNFWGLGNEVEIKSFDGEQRHIGFDYYRTYTSSNSLFLGIEKPFKLNKLQLFGGLDVMFRFRTKKTDLFISEFANDTTSINFGKDRYLVEGNIAKKSLNQGVQTKQIFSLGLIGTIGLLVPVTDKLDMTLSSQLSASFLTTESRSLDLTNESYKEEYLETTKNWKELDEMELNFLVGFRYKF